MQRPKAGLIEPGRFSRINIKVEVRCDAYVMATALKVSDAFSAA